jgi:hypothetical protein
LFVLSYLLADILLDTDSAGREISHAGLLVAVIISGLIGVGGLRSADNGSDPAAHGRSARPILLRLAPHGRAIRIFSLIQSGERPET